jgi:small subunit ribosomal protein S20
MPNIKSAKKRVKVIAVKTAQNKHNRSDLRTAIKKAELALQNGDENKLAVVKSAMQKIDCAVTKGILHKNTAARKKSQLARNLNKAG